MDDLEFRLYLKIDVVQLDFWIEQGWLIPETSSGQRQFRDADVARARLILDLMGNMGVNEAAWISSWSWWTSCMGCGERWPG